MQRDFVKLGQNYSADYLRQTELDASDTFQSFFSLVNEATKNATDSDVISTGSTDVSPVYRVQSKNPNRFFRSVTVTGNQTGTAVILPSEMPDGVQMVVTAYKITTPANSGIIYLHNLDKSIVFGKLYVSNKSDSTAQEVYIPMGIKAGVYITSTQGDNELYVGLNAYFERKVAN